MAENQVNWAKIRWEHVKKKKEEKDTNKTNTKNETFPRPQGNIPFVT